MGSLGELHPRAESGLEEFRYVLYGCFRGEFIVFFTSCSVIIVFALLFPLHMADLNP